jgi:DNA-directed RNA polymerase subunit RPC12/RpoP
MIGSWSTSSCGQSTVSASPKPSSRPLRCIPQRQERVTKHQKGARSRTKTYHRPLCSRPELATATEIEWSYNCSAPCLSRFGVRTSPNNSVTYSPDGSSTPEQMNDRCRIHGVEMCLCYGLQANYLNDSGVCDSPDPNSFFGGEISFEPLSYALPEPSHLNDAAPEGPRFIYPHALHRHPEYNRHHAFPQSSRSSKPGPSPQGKSTPPKRASTQSSTSSGGSKYSCQSCQREFTQARNQLRHEKSSCDSLEKHTKKQVRCTECKGERRFSRPDGLDKHMKVVHKRCSKCNKVFNTSEEVAEHRAANRYHPQCTSYDSQHS